MGKSSITAKPGGMYQHIKNCHTSHWTVAYAPTCQGQSPRIRECCDLLERLSALVRSPIVKQLIAPPRNSLNPCIAIFVHAGHTVNISAPLQAPVRDSSDGIKAIHHITPDSVPEAAAAAAAMHAASHDSADLQRHQPTGLASRDSADAPAHSPGMSQSRSLPSTSKTLHTTCHVGPLKYIECEACQLSVYEQD